MSAESAHLSTFGAETETEAEIRSTSNSDNVEITYSLQPMMHIFLAKVGANLQHAISHEPKIHFCKYRVLASA